MSQRDDAVTPHQMLDYAKEARGLLKGKRRSVLDRDRVLSLAVIRLLEVLGEAANRASPETRKRHPAIQWRQIIGLRNRLIHAYDSVDTDVLWRIVKKDLPKLIAALEVIAPPGP